MFILGMSIVLIPRESGAGAPPIADTPCDSLYYQTLSARAWLEAEREITQNQNLILKPDSVFEYTCFDLFLRELAQHAANMFSETTQFGTPLGDPSMNNALDDLIGDSLINYINANFENVSGGTYDLLGGHQAANGIDHQPAAISNGTYSCDIMNRVWTAAKCINFASNPAEDGFYTFQQYSTALDKRHLPGGVRCSPINATWTANITTSTTSPPWTDDPMQTYLAHIDPANCGGGAYPPIPTGIQVVRTSATPTTYAEHVCIQPGCRYDPSGSNCVAN